MAKKRMISPIRIQRAGLPGRNNRFAKAFQLKTSKGWYHFSKSGTQSNASTNAMTAMLPDSSGWARKYPIRTASGRHKPMIKWLRGMLIVSAIRADLIPKAVGFCKAFRPGSLGGNATRQYHHA